MPLNSVLGGMRVRSAISALSILLVACSSNEDFSWIHGHWISDKEATRVANPHIEEMRPDQIESYLGMYGKLRWSVGKETFVAIQENGDEYPGTYTINRRTEAKNEYIIHIIEDDGMKSSFYIWRTANGFCNKAKSIDFIIESNIETSTYERDGPIAVECYKPYEQ